MAKVVLDPGHGGKDSGAVGNGLQEKVYSLQFCQKVAPHLRRSGVDVLLTRTSDRALGEIPDGDLLARADFANRNEADLFVSFHLNSNGGTPASGYESYVYNADYRGQERTEQARQAVHREMAAVATRYGIRDRGCKKANFAVLRETNMPACLVEIAFINHPQDAARLKDLRFQNEMAVAAARGICEALGVRYLPERPSDPLEEAIAVLQSAGVITTAEYWQKAARLGQMAKGEYVGQLIQNMARKLKEK